MTWHFCVLISICIAAIFLHLLLIVQYLGVLYSWVSATIMSRISLYVLFYYFLFIRIGFFQLARRSYKCEDNFTAFYYILIIINYLFTDPRSWIHWRQIGCEPYNWSRCGSCFGLWSALWAIHGLLWHSSGPCVLSGNLLWTVENAQVLPILNWQISGLHSLHAQPVVLDYLASKKISSDDLVVVSPDVGGVARARAFAKKLSDAPLAIVDKRRHGHNLAEVDTKLNLGTAVYCIDMDFGGFSSFSFFLVETMSKFWSCNRWGEAILKRFCKP